MSEKNRRILAAIVTKLDELEELYRKTETPFQEELRRTSGLSIELLHQYREVLNSLQKPFEEKKLFATLPETEQTATDACPLCAGALEIQTSLEPASQRGHVMIVTYYSCTSCDYQDLDKVSLPTEIALQQHNLKALLKGV